MIDRSLSSDHRKELARGLANGVSILHDHGLEVANAGSFCAVFNSSDPTLAETGGPRPAKRLRRRCRTRGWRSAAGGRCGCAGGRPVNARWRRYETVEIENLGQFIDIAAGDGLCPQDRAPEAEYGKAEQVQAARRALGIAEIDDQKRARLQEGVNAGKDDIGHRIQSEPLASRLRRQAMLPRSATKTSDTIGAAPAKPCREGPGIELISPAKPIVPAMQSTIATASAMNRPSE
ncbi:hypothetical protein EH240_09835 [Mesorhizobium tamadayense]|uniref:Uncharacterized protein n=1 Tax=Mesorhizobium tamadayense TaxID=425306 RepID=A0A3P3FZE0_9HYPH|nr:hypothetical protein [Mesorhizobium tamadayense]RRI03463.1 hypothetical protein EH240_09835 [Mesorhizobium tamadayense]